MRPNNKPQICNHFWRNYKVVMITQKSGASVPRLVQTCKKCGVAIHVPVYTLKQLIQKEIFGGDINGL